MSRVDDYLNMLKIEEQLRQDDVADMERFRQNVDTYHKAELAYMNNMLQETGIRFELKETPRGLDGQEGCSTTQDERERDSNPPAPKG